MEASLKEGRIRMTVDTKGVHLTNELGGIAINCRKLNITGGALQVATEKDATLVPGGNLTMEAGSTLAISAGGDITVKGSSIDLKGSTGVTAEGKQIAVENDPVAGLDLHDIEVPSNKGTNTVPAIPHPYIGKLNDKLSSDVSIGGKAAATEGSMSEFGSPGHFPMPPGVKFSSKPDNKGEVTGGCIDSVSINGAPAAVLGSTVTTCDDAGQQDHCTIMAVGAVVTFPIQYPGQDPEQYKRDGGLPVNVSNPAVYTPEEVAYRDEPKSLNNLQWSSSEVEKGTEATLSCSTSGVRDGAAVFFSIYPDGADPETDPPLIDIRGENTGSRAEVKWHARDIREADNDNDMKWFFTAWTLYCPKEKSSTMEITRALPEFSELKWELVTFDEEGAEESREETRKISNNSDVCLSATVKNLDDNENVYLKVFDISEGSGKQEIHRKLVTVKDGVISYFWEVEISKEKDTSEPIIPKLIFDLESVDYSDKPIESDSVECYEAIRAVLCDEGGYPLRNIDYKIVTDSGLSSVKARQMKMAILLRMIWGSEIILSSMEIVGYRNGKSI